mgnify:CR=1 FL=1
MTFQPRDYQTELSDKGYKILNTLNILALIMEVMNKFRIFKRQNRMKLELQSVSNNHNKTDLL